LPLPSFRDHSQFVVVFCVHFTILTWCKLLVSHFRLYILHIQSKLIIVIERNFFRFTRDQLFVMIC